MRAFVLSGGGNYGALQVGALQALLDHGILPDLLVGTSAGALNAAWFAGNPSTHGLHQLARLWAEYAPDIFGGYNRLAALYHLASKRESILPNQLLVQLVSHWMPVGVRFGDYVKPRVYAVAARLSDGSPHVFGDDPNDLLIDGLMSSTALPPLLPPWTVNGVAYIDGGVTSNLPLRTAVERGADEIYALYICNKPNDSGQPPEGLLPVVIQSIQVMINQQAIVEVEALRCQEGVRLHLIRLYPDSDPGFWNFDFSAEMICDGYGAVDAYFKQEKTLP